ncbi:MAG: HAD family hydrolase [Erysipelotrichaceae bacterium]|jgi:beta-phosphoglucomutase
MSVIFDFNGTIIFDKTIVEESWQHFIYKHTGIRYSVEQLSPYVHGFNPDVTIKQFLKDDFGPKQMQQLVDEKETIYRTLCVKHENDVYRLADGIESFFDELKKRKVAFTIATAAPKSNVDFFYQSLKLDRWFKKDETVFSDQSFPGKPNPEIYLRAAGKIGSDIRECTIFEDAESGIKAAANAKAKTIVGVTSLLNKEQLLKAGADVIINDYRDLDSLLKIII